MSFFTAILIALLGADDYQVRQLSQEILDWATDISGDIKPILRATRSKDPEVARRARHIREHYCSGVKVPAMIFIFDFDSSFDEEAWVKARDSSSSPMDGELRVLSYVRLLLEKGHSRARVRAHIAKAVASSSGSPKGQDRCN